MAEGVRLAAGTACGMAAGALWGLVFLAPELARPFAPFQLAAGRYIAYGAVSAMLALPRIHSLVARSTWADWRSLFWLGLAGNIVYYTLLAGAVQLAGVATASLVIGFLPVTVTIAGSRHAGAVPLRRLVPGLAIAACGIACVGWQTLAAPMTGGSLAGRLSGLGCAFGALLSWTLYAIGNRHCLMARLDRFSSHEWNLLTGLVTGMQAIMLLPVASLTEPWIAGEQAWLRFGIVSVAVALLASIGGNALWNRMSRLLPLTLVGQMIVFETLFALLYGFLWEQRLPTAAELLALILLAASVMVCLAVHRPSRP